MYRGNIKTKHLNSLFLKFITYQIYNLLFAIPQRDISHILYVHFNSHIVIL